MSQGTHVDQVGGQHYQAGAALQHWDYMEKYDIDYLTSNATKYIMRWRKKSTPALDLGKAASYVEKALKCRPGEQVAPRLMPLTEVNEMCRDANLHPEDQVLMRRLLSWGNRACFESTLTSLLEMKGTLV